ncbi:MAG TPA: ABC-2 family transporter protein [Patescibacteria group bacterium]|nr:ABC-2 family transporter protein [Patescibacteria group bacterium]
MEVVIYRANSLLLGITPIVWMATTIIFISVIFRGTKEIGGWSFWEIMLLLGIHELIFLGTWMIFADNLEKFVQDVRQGTFDRVLIRPANHRFLVSFSSLDFTSIGSLVNTIVVLSVSLSHLTIETSITQFLSFLVSLFCGWLLVYFIYFSLSSLSLFFVNAETFVDWLLEATDFDRYPADIYSNLFRFFLLFFLPILFFAYVPTAILLNKLPSYYALLGVVMVAWFYLISTLIWRAGLKKYQSASS